MQKQTENDLQHRRIKEENQSLLNQVEKLQKALDSVPPELRGTAGEIVLFDHLHDAFQKDEFILKKVGVKMADVIQTVVLENGEKLAPPIVWDKKTDKDKISKDDIDKAQSYKIIHNTDFSVIVTSKGITNNTLIGTREGILLVHPSIVVEVCKLLRSFIIEMAKHKRSNNGRASKQAKLYDHLISAEYTRAIKTAKAMKASLDEQQRREENYHKEMWRERKKFIEEWSKADELNQQIIDDIIQDKPSVRPEDNLDDQREED